MDVRVDSQRIRLEREKRAWSQDHLAAAAGIGARTVQRIEATGVASYESVRAIAAVLELPVTELRVDASLAKTSAAVDEPLLSEQRRSTPSATARAPALRLRVVARWIGAALALAMLAGVSGFLLLQDYRKVRVLRTFERWVTEAEPAMSPGDR